MKYSKKIKLVQRWAAALLIVMCCALNAQAQDSTNTATWEETIAFIDKYIGYITKPFMIGATRNRTFISSSKIMSVDIYDYDRSEIYLKMGSLRNLQTVDVETHTDESKTMTLRFSKGKFYDISCWSYLMDEDEMQRMIKRAEVEDIEGLEKLTSECSRRNSSSFWIKRINDAEVRDRLIKAFKHLAYLANKDDKF